jgi:hypothetical protein
MAQIMADVPNGLSLTSSQEKTHLYENIMTSYGPILSPVHRSGPF